MERYICIHGHFYQPPRENAWLEVIEPQESARPFHDWNERINFECYAPNTKARILDDDRYIIRITNNYSRLSFNFGPTLLSWIEKQDQETYHEILDTDKRSMDRFDGHGSALAQNYSHLIMPLANRRDKETQVYWGIEDFKYRFGREPEGMWFAETAVDLETLEVAADHGIKFTVLAPRQAKAIKPISSDQWEDVYEGSYSTRRPYLCKLPSGKSIVIFFYDGGLSKAVAFEGLLNSGKSFADKLMNGFSHEEEGPQLVHIATDGESYGHHHRFGEMALADCLREIEKNERIKLINYGAFLEKHPPVYEAQIHENSSWSCVHGVERWRSNCGCNSGRQGWHQEWRQPLRETLDWLRDKLEVIYLEGSKSMLKDPWGARNRFIEVMLKDRDKGVVKRFLKEVASRKLAKDEQIKVLRLMEMQRQALQMYTSCGWFFDEVSGIETLQILQYALRAIRFAKYVSGKDYLPAFNERLAAIPSNVHPSAADAFEKKVLPSAVNLQSVAMHFAAASLFEEDPDRMALYNYEAKSSFFERILEGNYRLSVGRTKVKSRLTWSEEQFSFVVLYLGQQHLFGNISTTMKEEKFERMHSQISDEFADTNLAEVIDIMQRYFGNKRFTFWQLFQDEKIKILLEMTERSLETAEGKFREFYNDNHQLMTAMIKSELPIPEAFKDATEYVLNADLRHFFEKETLDIRHLEHLAKEFEKWEIDIHHIPALKLAASERIFQELRNIDQEEVSVDHIKKLTRLLEALEEMELKLDFWKSQNQFFQLIKSYLNGEWVFASEDWKTSFQRLGELLKVKGIE